MSYNLSITGHKHHDDPEEGKKFEEELAAKAREFVKTLEGAATAHGTFQHLEPQNLMETPPAAAPQ